MGLQLCRQLHDLGSSVVIADINESAGTALADELDGADAPVSFSPTDMTVPAQVGRLVADTVNRHGRIDYFFNGVGLVMGSEIRDTPLDDWLNLTDTNLHATINGTHVAYQQMLLQDAAPQRGHIINFASLAGLLPVPLMTAYSGTKFAVVGLTLALRAEARSLGVRVSVITPGFVRTPIYETATYHKLDKQKVTDLIFNKLPVQTPDTAARNILKGVARDKAVIQTLKAIHPVWWFYRLSPSLYLYFSGAAMRLMRRRFRTQ